MNTIATKKIGDQHVSGYVLRAVRRAVVSAGTASSIKVTVSGTPVNVNSNVSKNVQVVSPKEKGRESI